LENIPWANGHYLDALELLGIAHAPSEPHECVFGRYIKGRGIVLGITSDRRYQHHDALFVSPEKSAHGQTGELDLRVAWDQPESPGLSRRSWAGTAETGTDRMIHIDVNMSIAIGIRRLRVVPEIGIWL